MALAPYENLKGFASSRPPLMIFMLCLGLFGLILMSLAYYVKMSEMIPADASQDWNTMLENFAKLEFCIATNGATESTTTAIPSTKGVTVAPKGTKDGPGGSHLENTTPAYESQRNYSFSMLLNVRPTKEFLSIPHNVTHLTGNITGDDIGLVGQAKHEEITVTMELPYDWNSTHCYSDTNCKEVQIYACVHLQASPVVFPPSRSPAICESLNDTGIEYSARMMYQKREHMYSAYFCQHRPVIKVQYKLSPGMTVWLSLPERSVINLHLMHTSYFVFVMVVMVFCYAIIKGRPNRTVLVKAEKGYVPPFDHD